MNFPVKRVLCPTDLSSVGDSAVSAAYRLAGPGGVVDLVHVQEFAVVPSPLDGTIVAAYYPDDATVAAGNRHTREHLERLVPDAAGAAGIRTEIHALHDTSVAGTILGQARERGSDVIVMGTHGRSGIARLMLGSVATEVLRKAHIPVVLVHDPAK